MPAEFYEFCFDWLRLLAGSKLSVESVLRANQEYLMRQVTSNVVEPNLDEIRRWGF